MPSNALCFLLIALLCPSPWALATTVHRCEAANGRITFTTLSCTAGESLSLQDVRTFTPAITPATTTALMPEAEPRETSGMKIKRRELTVVGQSEDKCGNLLSARERREAIINQRVVAGMSVQDVESALGKPDKISIGNSTTRYRYDIKRGRSAHVEFDERGCTQGKAKSQTAKSPH
ncbi:cell envelope protein SmpA [Pseudomonas sp. RIT-PI-q]|uniref:hypothetical protein n=1 Tax=Pseudomonas sp. RIT-PI-q TaxID=1690247 RepID=UPI0006CD0FC8|nr:hypothetical protein [Pseudomonas sp. RIT-PI-q]KPG97681.1 cell envelope protein SmpA [Pseudomonas sp. RIT-PI-q]